MLIDGVEAKTAHYKLVSDIDFAGKYWTPIGSKTSQFEGVLDLGRYRITNIVFCFDYDQPMPSYSGLFWVTSDKAVIKRDNSGWLIATISIVSVVLTIGAIVACYVVVKKIKKVKYTG